MALIQGQLVKLMVPSFCRHFSQTEFNLGRCDLKGFENSVCEIVSKCRYSVKGFFNVIRHMPLEFNCFCGFGRFLPQTAEGVLLVPAARWVGIYRVLLWNNARFQERRISLGRRAECNPVFPGTRHTAKTGGAAFRP